MVGFHTVHGDLNFLYGQTISLEGRRNRWTLESNMVVGGDFVEVGAVAVFVRSLVAAQGQR